MSKLTGLEERIAITEATPGGFELAPNEGQEQKDLFGRWAAHPAYGRGIIVSTEPNAHGEVKFAYRSEYLGVACYRAIVLSKLVLDPETLTTGEEFESAPDGTIVQELENDKAVFTKWVNVWGKFGTEVVWASRAMFPCRVIRWGDGK